MDKQPTKRRAMGFHGEYRYCHPQWQQRLAHILENGNWQTWHKDDLVAASSTTHCYRVILDDGEVVYLKRYNYKKAKSQFTWPLASKAAVECYGYHIMQQLGINCAQVLATGEFRQVGSLRAAFIITKAIPNSDNLEKYARNSWYSMPVSQRQQIYKQIRDSILQQLQIAHQAGFCHHDLKWRNILVQQQQDNINTVWIDSPRARQIKFRKQRMQVLDLGALARLSISYLSPYQQMRFLRDYLGKGQLHQARDLFREIQSYLSRRPPARLELPPCDMGTTS